MPAQGLSRLPSLRDEVARGHVAETPLDVEDFSHMEDMATKQAARLPGLPLRTLLARLHRGRKLFECRLWDYAVANDLLKDPQPSLEALR